jgi:hypothetical protein
VLHRSLVHYIGVLDRFPRCRVKDFLFQLGVDGEVGARLPYDLGPGALAVTFLQLFEILEGLCTFCDPRSAAIASVCSRFLQLP